MWKRLKIKIGHTQDYVCADFSVRHSAPNTENYRVCPSSAPIKIILVMLLSASNSHSSSHLILLYSYMYCKSFN